MLIQDSQKKNNMKKTVKAIKYPKGKSMDNSIISEVEVVICEVRQSKLNKDDSRLY